MPVQVKICCIGPYLAASQTAKGVDGKYKFPGVLALSGNTGQIAEALHLAGKILPHYGTVIIPVQ